MHAKIFEHLVKSGDFIAHRRKRLGTIRAPDKKCPCVSEHTRHMTQEFRGRAHIIARFEIREVGRCSTKCFLRPVRERSKKVSKHVSLVVHRKNTTADASPTQVETMSDLGSGICIRNLKFEI